MDTSPWISFPRGDCHRAQGSLVVSVALGPTGSQTETPGDGSDSRRRTRSSSGEELSAIPVGGSGWTLCHQVGK